MEMAIIAYDIQNRSQTLSATIRALLVGFDVLFIMRLVDRINLRT